MDPMRDDSLIPSEIMRKTLLRPYRLRQILNTKSLSLTKLTTHPTMYNSCYGRLLRSSLAIADSSLPATTKTKSSNPLHSRCAVVEFGIKGKERQGIAAQFFKRIQQILDAEGVEYDNKVLVELINKHFPDWRRVLNECQRYSVSGKIDSGILATFSDVAVNELVKNLKEKNFPEVRKWVVNNLDNDTTVLLRRIYDACYDSLVPNSIPAAVLVLAKYQYQMAFVADQEINLLACLTEIMVECEFS